MLGHSWPTFSLSQPVQSFLFSLLWAEFFISSRVQNAKGVSIMSEWSSYTKFRARTIRNFFKLNFFVFEKGKRVKFLIAPVFYFSKGKKQKKFSKKQKKFSKKAKKFFKKAKKIFKKSKKKFQKSKKIFKKSKKNFRKNSFFKKKSRYLGLDRSGPEPGPIRTWAWTDPDPDPDRSANPFLRSFFRFFSGRKRKRFFCSVKTRRRKERRRDFFVSFLARDNDMR